MATIPPSPSGSVARAEIEMDSVARAEIDENLPHDIENSTTVSTPVSPRADVTGTVCTDAVALLVPAITGVTGTTATATDTATGTDAVTPPCTSTTKKTTVTLSVASIFSVNKKRAETNKIIRFVFKVYAVYVVTLYNHSFFSHIHFMSSILPSSIKKLQREQGMSAYKVYCVLFVVVIL
jgi:hypothetical protein